MSVNVIFWGDLLKGDVFDTWECITHVRIFKVV